MQHPRLAAATIADLARGYTATESAFPCLHCAQRFARHEIYAVDGRLLDAEGAAIAHVEAAHGGPFAALLALDERTSGLSAAQRTVLRGMYDAQADARIGEALGNRAASTVRNHRFQLREREREARLLLALWSLLPAAQEPKPAKPTPKEDSAMITTPLGERFAITEDDLRTFEARFFHDGVLTHWPSREKQRVMLAMRAARLFEPDRRYAEKEVNALLEPLVAEHHVYLRRYLVDYGFLDRERNGSAYWLVTETPGGA